MRRKTLLVFVTVITALSLYYGAKVLGGCPPSWLVTGSSSWSCANGNESKTWLIYWQDNNTSTKFNEGFGQCCGTLYTQECPPNLEEPVSFPITISGVPSEQWSETAYDRVCRGFGCENSPPPRTVTSTHTCRIAGGCNGPLDYGQYTSGCAPGFISTGGVCTRSTGFMNQCIRFGDYDYDSCNCSGGCDPSVGGCSPVVVDVLGNGFSMTSADNGVMFDLQGNGTPQQFSWIAAGSDDSWLALDRNNNGLIDSGRELFGNVTPQSPPPDGEEMNGFRALAEYDTAGFSGNGDGKINQQDSIFSQLRLWQDANHNGVSESCEMKTLPEAGLRKIDLDYRSSRRTDEFGNQFRYRTKVRDAQDAQLGRWAWDVYLMLQH